MSLHNIVEKLGGELHAGGTQANVPAPCHSLHDRSVSLRIGRDGQVLVHTFAGTDWREVMDDLRERGLIDEQNRPIGRGGVAHPRIQTVQVSEIERVAVARRIWAAGRATTRTLTSRHAQLRHIERPLPGPEVLRHLTEAPIGAYRERSKTMPAMLVGVSDETGALTAVEVTYLDPNGRRTQRLHLSRKTVGLVQAGSAVRLDSIQHDMLVGEGVFTTLSASECFNLPAWALLSTRNMRTWRPPAEVRSIIIAGDRGTDGETSAEILASHLRRLGLRVEIKLPPEPYCDWNEAAAHTPTPRLHPGPNPDRLSLVR